MSGEHWDGVSDCPRWWERLSHVAGTLAFDVGANGGETARLFAPNFGRVVALEPADESFAYLYDHVPDNVVRLQTAASDHVGALELSVASESIKTGQLVDARTPLSGLHPWGEEVERRTVRCTTLDALAASYGVPDLVKVDVEGHEVDVMRGASELVRKGLTRWMVECHAARLGDEVADVLSRREHVVELQRHSGYPPDSEGYREHFYLWALPKRLATAPW